jgi:hypothetical protein
MGGGERVRLSEERNEAVSEKEGERGKGREGEGYR